MKIEIDVKHWYVVMWEKNFHMVDQRQGAYVELRKSEKKFIKDTDAWDFINTVLRVDNDVKSIVLCKREEVL